MQGRSVLEIQTRLHALGYDPGPLDGAMGPQTERGISQFKDSIGFNPRPYYGPQTDAALFGPLGDSKLEGVPTWMRLARRLHDEREIKGPRHNPLIVKMWQVLGLPFRDDETPWCAGYVGYCLEQAGVPSTRSAAARSYEKWGQRLTEAQAGIGAVATFWRGSPNGWQGHVAFLEGFDERGRLLCRGGNQGDRVSVAAFDRSRLTGLWWPNGIPLPKRRAPVIAWGQASSTNEA